MIRRNKRETYNKTIENAEREARSTNSRNFFKQVKNMMKGYIPKTKILRNINNELINDTKEVTQPWKRFLENLLNLDAVTRNTKKVYQRAVCSRTNARGD